jgi:hypothetical protein
MAIGIFLVIWYIVYRFGILDLEKSGNPDSPSSLNYSDFYDLAAFDFEVFSSHGMLRNIKKKQFSISRL